LAITLIILSLYRKGLLGRMTSFAKWGRRGD